MIVIAAEEASTFCAAEETEGTVMSGSRRLFVAGLVALALLLLLLPPLVAALSVVDSAALDHVFARLQTVSRAAFWLQLGRFPVSLVLATWIARSPQER